MEINNQTIGSTLDGINLSALVIAPSTENRMKPRAVLQMVHGVAEHKERYIPLMKFLSEKGFICVMHDNRGHGQSLKEKGDLGYTYSAKEEGLVEDVFDVNRWIKKKYPGLPVFLFGHSLGSLIVRCYLKKHDDTINGLIVCGSPSENKAAGPGRMLARCLSFFKGGRSKSKLLANLTTGQYSKGFEGGSPNQWICSDPEVVKAYDEDPLCGFEMTINGYESVVSLLGRCYDPAGWKVSNPSLPIWFIAGEYDPCIETPEKWRKAMDRLREVGYKDVSGKLYPGVRHEIHNDINKQEVFADILQTLEGFLEK